MSPSTMFVIFVLACLTSFRVLGCNNESEGQRWHQVPRSLLCLLMSKYHQGISTLELTDKTLISLNDTSVTNNCMHKIFNPSQVTLDQSGYVNVLIRIKSQTKESMFALSFIGKKKSKRKLCFCIPKCG